MLFDSNVFHITEMNLLTEMKENYDKKKKIEDMYLINEKYYCEEYNILDFLANEIILEKIVSIFNYLDDDEYVSDHYGLQYTLYKFVYNNIVIIITNYTNEFYHINSNQLVLKYYNRNTNPDDIQNIKNLFSFLILHKI